MNPNILLQVPLSRPQWRLDRVVQLISHRPEPLRPGRYDDHFVRVYRKLLLALTAAGDDAAKREAVFREYPDVGHAHRLHYSPDIERRQILEARLLTSESIEGDRTPLRRAPKAIEYYEKLFFDVRERLECRDWILKVIIGPRSAYRNNKTGVMGDAERGYVYKLFAYYGGPQVLDAAISGLGSTTMPQRAENVEDWFNDALGRSCESSAAAAAAALQLNQQSLLQMLKLALSMRTGADTPAGTRAERPDLDEWAGTVLASINWEPAVSAGAALSDDVLAVDSAADGSSAALSKFFARGEDFGLLFLHLCSP